jgi:chaperonin cofactor prefoldin
MSFGFGFSLFLLVDFSHVLEEENADLRCKIETMTQQMQKNQKKIVKYQSKVQYNFM